MQIGGCLTQISLLEKKIHGKMQFSHRYADDFRKNKYSKQDKKSCQKFPRHTMHHCVSLGQWVPKLCEIPIEF